MKIKIIISLITAFFSSAAMGQEYTFSNPSDVKPLILKAITDGEAHGKFIPSGELADYLTARTGSAAPSTVNVTRLIKYKQEGCARVNVQFLYPEALQSNHEIDYQINYCLDGLPPLTEGKEFSPEAIAKKKAEFDAKVKKYAEIGKLSPKELKKYIDKQAKEGARVIEEKTKAYKVGADKTQSAPSAP